MLRPVSFGGFDPASIICLYPSQVDLWLDTIALSGVAVAAIILVSGAANFFLMLTLWVLYHSLVAVGEN